MTVTQDVSEKKGILLVDDESLVLNVLEAVLSPLKDTFNTYTASSGEQALKMLDDGEVKNLYILVTDLYMAPGMNGLDLCQRLKETNPSVYLIMVTGRPTDSMYDRFEKLGGFAILLKPGAITKLADTIRKAVANKPSIGYQTNETIESRLE